MKATVEPSGEMRGQPSRTSAGGRAGRGRPDAGRRSSAIGPQVRDVAVAPDGRGGRRRPARPSARQVVLLEDDLASDVRGGEGSASHRRQRSDAGPQGRRRIARAGRREVATLARDAHRSTRVIAPRSRRRSPTGRPVVALESTLISHGLPYPQNLEVASASEAAVRERGAVPATVAIHDGRMLVGLDAAALEALATAPAGSVRKAARPSLAVALADGGWAATTVSATMIAAHAAGIRVFATGGIGGVHRGALGGAGSGGRADLRHLVGPRGARAHADGRRLRRAEGDPRRPGDPRVPRDPRRAGRGGRPGRAARASTPGRRGSAAPASVPDIAAAADLVALHLGLGLGSGVLVCVPVPADVALPDDVARDAVERAVREADEAGIDGPALTPWLLARIADLTEGASLRANTALIVNDARVAGELAARLASA